MAKGPRRPSLKFGQKGPAVRAMQNGLHRALAAVDLEHENNRKGHYGSQTRDDVNRFKNKFGIRPVIGTYFGSDAWAKLEKHLGRYDRRLIVDHYKAIEQRARELEELRKASEPRAKLVRIAMRAYGDREHYVYRQFRPYPPELFSPLSYWRLDCSSFVTLIYKEAGLPDPNGFGYNGSGYTGSLWARGESTSNPKPGDLVFYGEEYTRSAHVAILVEDGAVVSFGSTPIKYLPADYRPIRGYRTYL